MGKIEFSDIDNNVVGSIERRDDKSGIFVTGECQALLVPIGTILIWPGDWPPDTGDADYDEFMANCFALCDGSNIDSDDQFLQEVIGGSKLPDLRGYFIRGYKSGVTGEIGCCQAETRILPSHTHTVSGNASLHCHEVCDHVHSLVGGSGDTSISGHSHDVFLIKECFDHSHSHCHKYNYYLCTYNTGNSDDATLTYFNPLCTTCHSYTTDQEGSSISYKDSNLSSHDWTSYKVGSTDLVEGSGDISMPTETAEDGGHKTSSASLSNPDSTTSSASQGDGQENRPVNVAMNFIIKVRHYKE